MLDWYEVLLAQKLNGGGSGPGPGPDPEPTPTDGNTHIYIEIPEGTPAANMTFYVRFQASVQGGVTIDWGDGVTESNSFTSAHNYPHTYSRAGKYEIILVKNNGNLELTGGSGSAIYGTMMGNQYNAGRIMRVVVGDNVTLSDTVFASCFALQTVVIPQGAITSIPTNLFDNCRSLQSIVVPTGVTGFTGSAFNNCYSLKKVTLPEGLLNISNDAFANCCSLTSITIPNTVTSIGSGAFSRCNSLRNITIPEGVTRIESNTFYYCSALERVTILGDVSEISNSAFDGCYYLAEYYFAAKTPPTIGASTLFNYRSDYAIYVPAESVEAYKAATNWSRYADKIQAMPE